MEDDIEVARGSKEETVKITWTKPVLITCGTLLDIEARSMSGNDGVAEFTVPES